MRWPAPTARSLAALALVGALAVLPACGRGARRAARSSSTPAVASASATPTARATGSAATPAVLGTPATGFDLERSVPSRYATLARTVTSGLDAWQAQLGATPAAGAAPVFAADLLVANANRGPALLQPATLAAVNPMLDRLRQLGIRGVTINVNFPLLNPDYPHSADYLAFYEAVAQRVRAHGMKLDVEQHVIFSGTAFSSVHFDYGQLPFDRFVAEFHAMTQLVIDRLHPDYLTLLSEPDTFAQLTGYHDASTPAGAAAWIGRVVAGINRGSTKLGAGAGSWLPAAPAYDEALAQLPLDYIDLHIYPMDAAIAATLQRIGAVARAAGKPLVIDEAWLQKRGAGDRGGVGTADAVFRRDAFSFWAPFDTRFLREVATYARRQRAIYVSPFWSTYLWAYVDYGPATKNLSYAQLSAQVNALAYAHVRSGAFTSTGVAYGAMAHR